VQYGISIVLALILLLGLALGILRRRTNTTAAIICHVAYDLLVGLPFPLTWFLVACAIQLPVLALLVWHRRRSVRGWLTDLRPTAQAVLIEPLPSPRSG
jgi:hypothetical protein